MKLLLSASRIPAIAIGLLALGIAAGGGAYAAGSGGGTISVCVHKGGGLYKAKKCAKHDSTLRWNVQGPPGNNGSPGAPGAPGANGAVAGFSASEASGIDITTTDSLTPKTILTKQLPAGSFIVSAKTVLYASSNNADYVNDECTLTNGSTADISVWSSPLTSQNHSATGTVSLEIAVSSNTPTLVTLSCYDRLPSLPPGFATNAGNSQLDAIQTSSNS